MSKQCVNTRDQYFKSLAKKYDVSTPTLELAIHAWWNNTDYADYASPEFEDYLNNFLSMSSISYSSKARYDKAHNMWEKASEKYKSISKDEIKRANSVLDTLFGSDNFTIYETSKEGVYTARIKEPVYKQSNKTASSSVIKVISGGQTGVDTIGLQVAKELGIETGGTAPKGFLREKGVDNEDISSYGLVEISDEEQAEYTRRKKKTDPYTGRTELNVRNSDGTVYFATSDDSAGLIATKRSAKEWKKPFIENPTATQLKEWIKEHNIKTLNVAGNRGSKLPSNNKVAQILKEALKEEYTTIQEETIKKSSQSIIDRLSESRKLVQQIIEDSKNRIKFDAETHTYYVDGKKADTSVTQYINGKKDYGLWSLPASLLGTTVDSVVRDFFSGNLKSEYPNLRKIHLRNLVKDLEILRNQFDEKFGEGNYEIVTTEFPIASKYAEVNKNGTISHKVMAGTMDMLIYDNKGNFYIYDMKTSRSGIKENDRVRYSKQLSLYKNILEINYPQLKGKIKELHLIEFDIFYPSPTDVTYHNAEDVEDSINGQLYVEDEDGDIWGIEDIEDYAPPRLKITSSVNSVKVVDLESLDKIERALIEEEIGKTRSKKEDYTPSITSEQNSSWYNSPLLTASERRFLANQVMNLTSYIISHLQTNQKANRKFLGEKYSHLDLTNMTRKQILEIVDVRDIFDYIKEAFYNPSNRRDIEDFTTLSKLDVAYNNFEAVIRQGYSKLISLEDITVLKVKPEFVKKEDLEDSLQEEFQQGSLEEKEKEYWQIAQRQQSARSSLSTNIRRLFERLPVLDQNGNYIKDKFGFNMDTFVDSGEAINSILTWVNDATTMEEMEAILENMAPSNPWLNSILKAIKEEPIRSQFFQNFRKDFTNYSIVTVQYNKGTGKREYIVKTVNTKGPLDTILNNTITSFKLGLMTNLIIPIKGDLEGRGRVNVSKVESLRSALNSAIKNIKSSNSTNIQEVITDFAEILSSLGLPVTTNILRNTFASDLNKGRRFNYDSSKIKTLALNISYLLDTLIENKNNTTYNPMLKEEKEGNIYNNYKTIISIFSPFISDSIESSTYENGKMYYSFTTPSYMGKLISRLSNALGDTSKFERFIEEEYGSYKWFKDGNVWNCPWLQRITGDKSLRQGLQHKVQLSFDKTDYTELSELGYTLSLMHEYFYDKNKKWAWYRLPILANKPSSEFIRFERLTGKMYKENIRRGLKRVFNQELMRIKTVLERAGNPNVEKIGAKGKIWFDIPNIDKDVLKKFKAGTLTLKDLITKEGKYIFSGTGAEFKFLAPLNNAIINKTVLGQLIVDKINGKAVNEDLLSKEFSKAVDAFMANQMIREKEAWTKMGLFEEEESNKNSKSKTSTYKYLSPFGKTKEEILTNLEEYVWNDMFATINIIELTATDLAYYKNVEDFQKRYSQVHAPSMRLNTTATFTDKNGNKVKYSKDGLERTMYLKDDMLTTSEIVFNVEKIFKDKIDSLPSQYKHDMSIMKSLIIEELKKVNVADAQGYSSPTSYRKKMGMQGKWTEEMEEAYNKIIQGDLNIHNLGIIWQPFKPFVYSQIRKPSGASTMSELKVPVQNKNSEYLLLIADAIMRSGNKTNKLQAIFDFMEQSAYTDGEYNGEGIDTVQFISAVNSGGMGAIDLSNTTSYEETLKVLEEAAYYRKDKKAESSNDNDRYDSQFVHSIPFEDYGMQQEVPAHLADHEQSMGSQVRILSVSDISDGQQFFIGKDLEATSREDLHKEYFRLLAENIRDSFETLKKDLKLNGSPIEQNKALSELLQETILKDQRYGNDLLRACDLDEKGEFVIPLSDPIQSIRVQQLLNSIIKSRINKQKVQGGPAVQVSAFGLSDELHIRWQDKNGNILPLREEFKGDDNQYKEKVISKQYSVAYFECYAPIPTEEMEKALLKPDGSYMSPEEAVKNKVIPEEALKAIGYRIPTEDKYSIIPLKIKGFVPKAAGESVIMPKEITTLTGSDFDIDKMYIMFKSFNKKETVDYNAVKRDIMKANRKTGEARKKDKEKLNITIDEIENGKVSFSEGSFEMGVWEYMYNDDGTVKSKYLSSKFTDKNVSKRKQRDNRIFDIQWAVLTHPDTMVKMFNPGSFNVQKKSARIITILKSGSNYTYKQLKAMLLKDLDNIVETSSNRNIIFPSTQVYFHKQNMTAGKLIGIFANNNTSHAFLSMQNITFNMKKYGNFTFNGVTISDTSNNRIDKLIGKDGSLISKTIAGFLAASVDAVKDPVLNYMNLNTMTAGPAMVLARLGFDSDSIGLLLTQPIIEDLSNEFFKRNNEGYVSIESIIMKGLNTFKEKFKIDYSILEKDLVNTKFTPEELAQGIKNGIPSTEFQARVLLLFKKLSEMSKDLGTLTFLTKFNSITNAAGPSIADTFVMLERYNRFLSDMENMVPPFNSDAIHVLDNNEMLKAFFDCTVGSGSASELLFSRHFPHYSVAFSSVLQLLRQTTKNNVDSKIINSLINDFLLYKLTVGENPVLDNSYENRSRYINRFVREFSEKSKGIVDNDFIKVITIAPSSKNCPVPTLESKTGGYSIDTQESIKDGWSDLLRNEETRSLGEDLFFYNLIRSGFNFSPKTASHLASVDVRTAIPGYIEALRNPQFRDSAVLASEFLAQFRRNHTHDTRIVPNVEENKELKPIISKNSKQETTITFSTANKYLLNSIIVSETGKDIVWAPMITYKDKVYMNPVSIGSKVVYTETTPLGNAHNFLEYNYSEGSNMRTVIGNATMEREKSSNVDTTDERTTTLPRSLDKAITRAIYDIFETREAQMLETEEEVLDIVPKNVIKYLKLNEELVPTIRGKVKEIIDKSKMC